jgi:hypothetical protein
MATPLGLWPSTYGQLRFLTWHCLASPGIAKGRLASVRSPKKKAIFPLKPSQNVGPALVGIFRKWVGIAWHRLASGPHL